MIDQACPLTTVLSEVLANMAFLFSGPAPDVPLEEDGWRECSIRYSGPERGTLGLRCSRQFGQLLSVNLLGLEPDSPQAAAQADDALGELVNVCCGQLVTTLYGQQAAFDLGIPQVVELPQVPEPLAPSSDGIELFVEGHAVQLLHARA